jgi:hypothetical protein
VKIDGKFYPLQNQEWVKICKTLTKSQISILYYLRSLDPYGNGMRIRASKIAEDLGITKRSVNGGIVVLEEKGYINLEDIDYSVKLSAGGCLCGTSPTVTLVGNSFPTEEENFPLGNGISHLGNEFPTEEENFPLGNGISHLHPETQVEQESQDSKINKTYSDFIKTLSEEERANFLNFCEEKTKNFSQPVNDIEAWLAHITKAGKNRWEVYYSKYLGSKQTQVKKPAINNALDEHRRELQRQQEQAQKVWEQSKNQNTEE